MQKRMHPLCLTCWRMELEHEQGKYADPTPTAAMRNICRDEYQKEAARLDRIGDIVPLLRQMAGIAGFEIIGRIPLRDKATGKEYR